MFKVREKLFLKRLCKMMLLLSVLSIFLWINVGSFYEQDYNADWRKVDYKVCHVNLNDMRSHLNSDATKSLKMIYYVTPTYPRPEQVPELTRLGYTLMHLPRLHWIVADDNPTCSDVLLNILNKTGVPFTLLSSPKPFTHKKDTSRGVANRLAALSWLRQNVREGVLYFGDDDNTVDLQLFDEIRNTKKVSMFPVGLILGFGVSSPVVNNGKVVGFFDSWPASRTFPVDMAGFAVNIEFLKPTATMPFNAGFLEDAFLRSLGLKMEDIEPLADNCTKVLVWHTQALKNKVPTLKIDVDTLQSHYYSNLLDLLKEMTRTHMVSLSPNRGARPFVTHDRRTFDIS
ncbi:galactosylgalactosylxylosylprotein 3-beta-glucuronosyltransferase S [Amyelois transitella]|uniref:galactosylgalactosylxylosylprotein 3-beta-glucuronosyltransferase S n=1 Tax=Amyelois transitella TaxID=680683 RepID=UPI0029906BD5|nr:galactosylgalactosylxylosylprotein 3-beta-glucuronosyltransferase S [Amyelois transitella]